MRRLLRSLHVLDALRGWVHALVSTALTASAAAIVAACMVLADLAVPGPVFAAAVGLALGALGLLPVARRASVRLANGLLGTVLPAPLLRRRFATAAWLLVWACAGALPVVATMLAVFALALLAVWSNGGGTVVFLVPFELRAGGAGAWVVAAAAGALVASVVLCAAYAFLLRTLASRLLGPGLAERLAAAEAEADLEAARNRLARDLHDSIGHTLTASTIQAAVAKQVPESDPGRARRAAGAAAREPDHRPQPQRRSAQGARSHRGPRAHAPARRCRGGRTGRRHLGPAGDAPAQARAPRGPGSAVTTAAGPKVVFTTVTWGIIGTLVFIRLVRGFPGT